MARTKAQHKIYTTTMHLFPEDRAQLEELRLPDETLAECFGRLVDFYRRHRHLDPVNRLRKEAVK